MQKKRRCFTCKKRHGNEALACSSPWLPIIVNDCYNEFICRDCYLFFQTNRVISVEPDTLLYKPHNNNRFTPFFFFDMIQKPFIALLLNAAPLYSGRCILITLLSPLSPSDSLSLRDSAPSLAKLRVWRGLSGTRQVYTRHRWRREQRQREVKECSKHAGRDRG